MPYQFDPAKPNALKRKIHRDWLELDPDELEKAIPIVEGRVRAKVLREYGEQHAPKLQEAFTGWLGIHGASNGGHFVSDWEDFLHDLRAARLNALDPYFEEPEDGIVYRAQYQF